MYRPEIDGLRALAVLPVILYHAGAVWFRGGYVGVDVFFVISGYLITQILVEDLEAGQFSIGLFYERRARRILPALFLVMAACVPAAWSLMGPRFLKSFAETIVAVSVFASNVFFAATNDYFADGADQNPLLHTWSLGVEEQFYIIFPVLLLLCWRAGRKRAITVTIAIALASFALSEWASHTHRIANFFLIPFRAWELMAGAMLALSGGNGSIRARVRTPVRDVIAAFGLLSVAAAVVLFDRGTPFPGTFALLPVVGSGLVLQFADQETRTGRLLAWRPLVGIGLISYSAYLWHQPLLAFAQLASVSEPPTWLVASLVVATFPLAYLSWRFVETPFRRRTFLSRNFVFRLGAVGSLLFMMIGAHRYWIDRDNHLSFARRANYGLSARCEFDDHFELIRECTTAPEPRVLVWGDSYAMHLVEGLLASDQNLALAQATKSICGPFIDVAPYSRIDREQTMSWSDGCVSFNRSVMTFIANTPSLEVVVLASPFDQYVDGDRYDLVTSRGRVRSSLAASAPLLERTIEAIRSLGKRVVLFAPPPAGEFNMGMCTERLLLGMPIIGPAKGCVIDRAAFERKRGGALELLETVSRSIDVPVLSFEDVLCDLHSCRTILDGVPLYVDGGHFSYPGIELLGKKLDLAGRVLRQAR